MLPNDDTYSEEVETIVQSILVTGGAGYIGSHTCLELIKSGRKPIVFDDFSNASPHVIERLEELSGTKIDVVEGDVRNFDQINKAIKDYKCDAVIHFAGLKAVGESEVRAIDYHDVNVIGTHVLLRAMKANKIDKIVFSSSATVYGVPKFLPYTEDHPRNATSTYGQTKLSVEYMLEDVRRSGEIKNVAILRYFNPIGAHPSGRIGEAPNGIPNNLAPYVVQVACGKREAINIWGDDYDTPDGTGVRDYIHVVDLAQAHLAALDYLDAGKGAFTVNLGTGNGSSVKEVIAGFEKACGKKIPMVIGPRRSGDIACFYADPSSAKKLLGWSAKLNMEDMCRDQWKWQENNPNGYDEA
ncbi:UDP-glucose 4-epimerase GalE [Hirschia baltica]|uniref:UDP-glucose 4-epimerase GalE n=1 Tax=Hirschia baltica TaxID=2724 RepID=UPI0006744975|nr:UDP-glucose 4-epimerase GalE [Hirschia baltica]